MSDIQVGKSGIRAYAPATIGNISCGFDLLGMAVDEPGDVVQVKLNYDRKVRIIEIVGDGGRLPMEVDQNTAGIAVKALKKHIQKGRGIDIILHKNLPLCSGMGSSAASAVAALMAANKIWGEKLTKQELIPFALKAEAKISGSVHGDNAIPSLLGGIVLITSYNPLKYIQLPIPKKLYVTLTHPQFEISTREARELVPKEIPTKKVIKQNACIASFVAGCYQNNLELIKDSMHDYIAQPKRYKLIKGFSQMESAIHNLGAFNLGISGSGPSVFSLSNDRHLATKAGRIMQKYFYQNKYKCEVYVSKVNKVGAVVLE